MKTTKLFFMAALALTSVACSNDDNDIPQPVAPEQPANGEITITAIVSSDGEAATRALSINGSNIASTFETTDEFAILFSDGTDQVKRIATVSSLDGTTAKITFTIPATVTTNTPCTIIYPASAANAANTDADVTTALAVQNGDLSTAPDVRKGTATIDVSTKTLSSVSQLAAQNSIFKFALKDIAGSDDKAATEFKVSDASGNVITTVTLGSAASEFYVALPVLETGTYWFNATADSKPCIAKATVSTATMAGKYYQSTVKMATLGDLMGANGKFYADAAAVTAASTTAIGVIAYLGNDATTEAISDGGGHGLVLCLKNAASGSGSQWSTETSLLEFGDDAKVTSHEGLMRTTNVSGYTNTKTLTEKTDAATNYKAAYAAKNYTPAAPAGTTGWFLPSAQQWVKMQTGLGGQNESAINWNYWFDSSHTGATAWETALSKAGSGNYDSIMSATLYYWSSSENSKDCAVSLGVGSTSSFGFYWNIGYKDKGYDNYRVRSVLAF